MIGSPEASYFLFKYLCGTSWKESFSLETNAGNAKNTVVQNLLSVVFASDTNKDQIVDEEEVELLMMVGSMNKCDQGTK